MQVHKNEIYVQRGESFTMRKKIVSRNGYPYIVGCDMSNPYWLVSISSSKQDKSSRYILNKWLSLKNSLRFKITYPIDIHNIPIGNSVVSYDSFNAMQGLVPSGYEGDNLDYANVAVFVDSRTGECKYFKYSFDGNIGNWIDYDCILSTSYLRDVTKDWSEQQYYYSISLVSGTDLKEYLINVCRTLRLPAETSEDVEILYKRIYDKDKTYVEGIDVNKPLLDISTEYPILLPTKFYVSSNLKGGK